MSSWDIDLASAFSEMTEREVKKKRLEVLTYLLTRIIQRSPVDTGAFRGNHRVTVGVIDSGYDKSRVDKSGSGVISAGVTAAAAASALETIFVQNNLPYAERLENGYSGQAPQGIYALSIMDAKAKFNELF